jgi:hypothetical protein
MKIKSDRMSTHIRFWIRTGCRFSRTDKEAFGSIKGWSFLTRTETIRFSRRALLHGVSQNVESLRSDNLREREYGDNTFSFIPFYLTSFLHSPSYGAVADVDTETCPSM